MTKIVYETKKTEYRLKRTVWNMITLSFMKIALRRSLLTMHCTLTTETRRTTVGAIVTAQMR